MSAVPPSSDNWKVSPDLAKCAWRAKSAPPKLITIILEFLLLPILDPFSQTWHLTWEAFTSLRFCPLWHVSVPVAYGSKMFFVPAGSRAHFYLVQAEPANVQRAQKKPKIRRNQNKITHFFFPLQLSLQKADTTRTRRYLGLLCWNLHFENGNDEVWVYPIGFIWTGRANFSEQEVSDGFWVQLAPGLG